VDPQSEAEAVRLAEDAARRQAEWRLRHYYEDQALFRQWTEEEYRQALPADFPTDSVRSPRIDGMPQARVAGMSNPTLRTVMQREQIRARVAAQAMQRQEELAQLQERMVQMAEWWATLSDRERDFVNWRWFEGCSAPQVGALFAVHRADYPTPGPESERAVYRWAADLLDRAARAWGLLAPPPAA